MVVSFLFAMNIIILEYVTQLRFEYSTNINPNHLVIIQHGLNYPSIVNFPTYFFLKKHLSNKEYEDNYMIYIAHSNSSPHLFSFLYHTNNGIVHASTNLANEILEIVKINKGINKISFIGSSIGGNYIRYTSYLLYKNKKYYINNKPFFEEIKGINLISLAAPHLGIRDWINNILTDESIDLLLKYLPSLTVKELLNIDDNQIINQMNKKYSNITFSLFDKVSIFYNSGWDSLVTCSSSSFDENNNHCQIAQNYCNQNRNNVFDEKINKTLNKNDKISRIPICLKRNSIEKLMAHAILSMAMPPISTNVANLLTTY